MSTPGGTPVGARSRWSGLALATGLGLALLIVSFLRLIGDAQSAILGGAVFDAAFATPLWGSILGGNLVLFALALVALHAFYGIVCWGLAKVSDTVWRSSATPFYQHVLLWYVLLTIALLASNAGNVPQSSLGEPYHVAARSQVLGLATWLWIVIVAAVAVVVTLAAGLRHWLIVSPGARKPAVATAGLAAVIATVAAVLPNRVQPETPPDKPNVILIGLDSLRADIVHPTASEDFTPNLIRFIEGGTLFTDAITPLARTFPSVTTILTGRHPHTTGAVMNLSPRDIIHEGDTLGRIMGRAGYSTTYATDEVRFSNIDASYGFETQITPPIGVSEIVISFAADTPLSNHVVNTWFGRYLFPHVHANRGASRTYDPDSFLHRIDHETDFGRPVFLAAHLTLAHWPYVWMETAKVERRKHKNPPKVAKWPRYYVDAVRRADRQFGDLMRLLEKRGVLKNAIVVVYSDHGESFGERSEFLPEHASGTRAGGDVSKWGHGTSVLIPDQYRVVLAIRSYGASAAVPKARRVVNAPVAVQDIVPTLTDLLHLQSKDPYDGRSLIPLLTDDPAAAVPFAARIRFTETEFTPRGLAASPSGAISTSAFYEAAKFYEVNQDTDRLELKRRRLTTLLSDREYAALGETLLVAALPSTERPPYEYFSVELDSGAFEPIDAGGPPADAGPEALLLWQALHQEFGRLLHRPPRVSPNAMSPPARAL
jgi:arylsulfatase A-like enzyme